MTSVDHSKRGHSEFGGSGAARWLACSASILDARGLPPLPSSEAAEEGTKDHELAELLLKGGVMPEDTDPDRKERVESYIARIKMLEASPLLAGMIPLVEEFVELNALAWGSADFALVQPWHTGYLVDYKGGIKPVEVKDNAQLAFYAVCLAEKYDLTQVICQIFQPNYANLCNAAPSKILKIDPPCTRFTASWSRLLQRYGPWSACISPRA
jgi:hypothetical protein